MTGYRCNTEGCALGDCGNCVAVAALVEDAARWRFVRDSILVLRSWATPARVEMRGWTQFGWPTADAPRDVTEAVDRARAVGASRG